MKTFFSFVLKHWLTLALLIGSLVLVRWIVASQRAPGAMSVIEAQGMDMAAMKPPPGVFPVAAEKPRQMSVGSAQTYPGEVLAFSDEDVVARIPGQVDKVLVYPGDRVHRGQLLATLKADEYGALAAESQLMAGSKSALAMAARRDVDAARQAISRANAGVTSAQAALNRSQADLEALSSERDRAIQDSNTAHADLDQSKAEARFAEQELTRNERLHKAGAISLEELQSSQRDRDAKQAAVRAAESKLNGSKKGVEVAGKRIAASEAAVKEAKSGIAAAQADRSTAQANLRKSQEQAKAASSEAGSAKAGASGSATMANYRELRALSDGEVAERVVSPGTSVAMGQTILRLKAMDRVRVQAEIPQAMAGKVREGAMLDIEADGVVRSGSVSSVFPTVSGESRTFRIEAILANSDRVLKSGMFVRVQLQGDNPSGENSLAVRTSAIQTDAEGRHFVWVVSKRADADTKSDWTCTMHPEVSMPGPGKCPICHMPLVERKGMGKFVAEKNPVSLGPSDGEFTAIVSGIGGDEQVIWAGLEDLFPEAPVQPTEWNKSGPKSLPMGSGTVPGHASPTDTMPGMKMDGGAKQ